MMAIRKIPMRKCIGCNTSKDKRELIRVVRNAEGEISIDTTGKKPGRGAYICKDKNCLKLARKGKKIDKAFEVAISDEIYDRLEQELADE
ncbi:MAG: YlxR family protein [Oscillospiraceae bacterium]|nr:YlxR family protein [Oscillospiraceae bacterium]